MFDKIVIKELKLALEAGHSIGVYRNIADRSTYAIGFVLKIEGGFAWMQEIEEGEDDGISCFRLSDVWMLRKGGPTIEGQEAMAKWSNLKTPGFDLSSMKSFLQDISSRTSMVTIADDDNDKYTGFVLDASDVYVCVSEIDDIGREQGTLVLDVERISAVIVEGLYERNRKRLHDQIAGG